MHVKLLSCRHSRPNGGENSLGGLHGPRRFAAAEGYLVGCLAAAVLQQPKAPLRLFRASAHSPSRAFTGVAATRVHGQRVRGATLFLVTCECPRVQSAFGTIVLPHLFAGSFFCIFCRRVDELGLGFCFWARLYNSFWPPPSAAIACSWWAWILSRLCNPCLVKQHVFLQSFWLPFIARNYACGASTIFREHASVSFMFGGGGI